MHRADGDRSATAECPALSAAVERCFSFGPTSSLLGLRRPPALPPTRAGPVTAAIDALGGSTTQKQPTRHGCTRAAAGAGRARSGEAGGRRRPRTPWGQPSASARVEHARKLPTLSPLPAQKASCV